MQKFEADWTSSMRLRGNRGALGLEAHTDTALVYPIFTFAPSRRGDWVFEPTGAPDTFSFSYLPTQTCSTFEGSAEGFQFSDKICGAGKVMIDEGATALLRTSFDAVGLPLVSPSGETRLESYHMEAEFLTVRSPERSSHFHFPRELYLPSPSPTSRCS